MALFMRWRWVESLFSDMYPHTQPPSRSLTRFFLSLSLTHSHTHRVCTSFYEFHRAEVIGVCTLSSYITPSMQGTDGGEKVQCSFLCQSLLFFFNVNLFPSSFPINFFSLMLLPYLNLFFSLSLLTALIVLIAILVWLQTASKSLTPASIEVVSPDNL